MSYRFIVIDDEYYVRQRVKRCINWEELGFYLVGEADNVPDALTLLEQQAVDLAIVDITMPGENGLDFLCSAQKKSPNTRCIILSGYADFEFARCAMRYGVESYLTKPVNRDEMQQAVLRIRSLLNERRQRLGSGQFLHRFFMRGQSFEKNVAAENLMLCGIRPEIRYMVLLCGFAQATFPQQNSEKKNLPETAVAEVLFDELEKEFDVLSTTDTFGHILLLITEGGNDTALTARLESLIHRIRQDWNKAFYIGCGRFLPGTPESLLESYREADLAFLSKVLHPDIQTVLRFESCPVSENFLEPFNRQLEIALETKNRAVIKENLETVFDKILHEFPFFQLLELELSHLLILAKSFAAKRNFLQMQVDSEVILLGCWEMIAASSDLTEISRRIQDIYLGLMDIASAKNSADAPAKLVREAVELIEQLYRRCDFSLDILSARLLISPSYLSSTFKKHTGSSIVQYITHYRMEEAKKMLLAQTDSLEKIAEAVGFNDPFYFSRCFKKHFGVSPSKLRRFSGTE